MFHIQSQDFEKIATDIIPHILIGPLERIGIASQERGLIGGKVKSLFKHKVKDEMYGEDENDNQSSDAQSGGTQHGRNWAKGNLPTNKNRKAIQIIGQRGFGGQQVFLS